MTQPPRNKTRADKARDGAPPVKDVTAGPVAMQLASTNPGGGGFATEGEWTAVKSSNIKKIRWERALSVEFHNGKIYHYVGVPPEVWRALMGAKSHGSFLQTAVINKYPVRKT